MKNLPPTFITGKLVPNIGKASKYINSLIKQSFQAHKIPLSKEQFIVLLRLEEGPQPQSFLAEITERNKGSLTRLVQSLEKKRYVERKCCKNDQRVNHVEITPSGRDIIKRVKPLMIEIYQKVELGIDSKDLEKALSIILKVQENALVNMESDRT